MTERPWWTKIAQAERGAHRELTEEEDALGMRAYSGILQGDLIPLAEYLRAGLPFNFIFRREIVQMITGEDNPGFRIELIKNRRGAGNAVTKLQTNIRDLQIGWFIHERLPKGSKQAESVFHEAMDHFGEGRAVIVAAWSRYKKTSWFRLGNSPE